MLNKSLNTFRQLLKAVAYPGVDSFDENTLETVFRNEEEKEKQALFLWIVKHFADSLESYVSSDEKLQELLVMTSLVKANHVSASFLCGTLPHKKQLNIWRRILGIVFDHKQNAEPNSAGQEESPNPDVPPRFSLIPEEYQKEFEERTQGNYKQYVKTMSKKLLEEAEEDEDSGGVGRTPVSQADLEDAVQNVLDWNPSPNVNQSVTSLDVEAIAEFCSKFERILKPQINVLEDTIINQDVTKLPQFAEFLQVYSFLSKVHGFSKALREVSDMMKAFAPSSAA